MQSKLFALGTAFLVAGVLAGDTTSRERINGEWLQAGVAKDAGESWIMESKQDTIHVTELRNGQKVAEFDCNTEGRDCPTEEDGRRAKVSFWFNGDTLVELVTRGSEVVKRRFSVGAQGDTLEVETIPIVPEGKSAVLQFKQASAARK